MSMGSRDGKQHGPTGTPRGMREVRRPDGSNWVPQPAPETGKSAYPPAHPALARLCGLLGRDAAAFSRRYRYAGLGRLQLICSQFMDYHDDDAL